MKTLFILVIAALLVTMFSCKLDNNPTGSNTNNNNYVSADIFPLKVGNSWSFKFSYIDSTGITKTDSQYDFTISVVGDTLLNGQKYYKVTKPFNSDTAIYTMLMCNKDYSNYVYDDTAYLNFKYPAPVNDSYYFGSKNDTKIKITSVSETVTNAKGTFTGCYIYEGEEDGKTGRIYYLCPGKGIVKIVLYDYPYPSGSQDFNKKVIFELKDYHLN